ncbi:hypothetical protein T06_11426 [Trichinella sp. T6]|nr:hypothetical protein T06_11426 [Trichinella sp. T6]
MGKSTVDKLSTAAAFCHFVSRQFGGICNSGRKLAAEEDIFPRNGLHFFSCSAFQISFRFYAKWSCLVYNYENEEQIPAQYLHLSFRVLNSCILL